MSLTNDGRGDVPVARIRVAADTRRVEADSDGVCETRPDQGMRYRSKTRACFHIAKPRVLNEFAPSGIEDAVLRKTCGFRGQPQLP
jgi:hypothetical protein